MRFVSAVMRVSAFAGGLLAAACWGAPPPAVLDYVRWLLGHRHEYIHGRIHAQFNAPDQLRSGRRNADRSLQRAANSLCVRLVSELRGRCAL